MTVSKVALGLALAAAACGGSNKKGDDPVSNLGTNTGGKANEDLRIPKVDGSLCDTGGKREETFDLDSDNRPDVWKLWATVNEAGTTREVLTCKQVDLDHNGKKDYVARFDDSGSLITEEYDFDFDGVFDARVHYDKKTHRKFLVERDTGYDRKPDVWEKYDPSELLESVRRDQNLDGKPDTWEHYRAGVLEKIQWDDDFDGIVDRHEEVKAAASPVSPIPAPTGVPPPEEAPTEDKPAPATPPADDTTKPKSKSG
jgi:hypothetical protein